MKADAHLPYILTALAVGIAVGGFGFPRLIRRFRRFRAKPKTP